MPPAPDWFWIVSPLILIAGWFVVNAITSKRELNNWRRTTLTNAVSSMIEASNKRLSLIKKKKYASDDTEAYEHDIRTAVQQIEICRADQVYAYASQIRKAHIESRNAIYDLELLRATTSDSYLEPLTPVEQPYVTNRTRELNELIEMNQRKLHFDHRMLVRELQIELGLRKFEFDPDAAQVLTGSKPSKIHLPPRMHKWIWTRQQNHLAKKAEKKALKNSPSVKP